MKVLSRPRHLMVLILILLGFGVYAYLYIQATSFVLEGTRYYNLFDDAMVSICYAWNNGLVWNVGERVEGFTNLFWALFMAFWHLLPLSGPQVSLAIQVSGGVFLALNLVVIYKIVQCLTDDLLALSAALGMTAFYGLLGKTDKVIARQPVKAPVSLAGIADVRPGHMKWDYSYSPGKLEPDVIVQLWEEDYKSAEPYLVDYELVNLENLPFYLRKNSPRIRWDVVK